MTTRTLPKFFSLTLAAVISTGWLGTVVGGMHSQAPHKKTTLTP